jgi:hypothetical protein
MVDFTTNHMNKDVVDNKYSAITKEGLNAITSAMDLSVYQHKEAERQQKLSLLAEEDLAYTIRKNINYFWVDYLFDSAKKWCEMRTQKYDKRKRYTEQDNYNCLLSKLKEIFKVETLEIIRMTYLGFDQCEMWIEFTTDSDYVFRLEIPKVKAITPKNMVSLRYGKAGLAYYENSCCIINCGSSYNVLDLRKTMNDIITLPEYQKHLSKTHWNEFR